jgi:Ohr subfamily peroxiredoxin
MVQRLEKDLYMAEASVQGGRAGHGRSSDGRLDFDLRPPTEMGGDGNGTNPEQLFALGYAACFQSALGVVGRRLRIDTEQSTVTGKVTIGTIGGGAFGLKVALDVELPGVDAETAQKAVEAAHEVCPYSNATRGNIEVALNLV